VRPPPEPSSLAACYSNRAAAHLKKKSYVFAERDTSAAIECLNSVDLTDNEVKAKFSSIKLKVLYRRAVARKVR
jgi:hypothetical protein